MKDFNFSMTDEAKRLALETISDSGLLDLVMTVKPKLRYSFELKHKGVTICSMPDVTLDVGDKFELKGVKISLGLFGEE